MLDGSATVQAAGQGAWRRFLGAWPVATAVLLGLVAALNVAVDPFFVFGSPLVPGLNQYKPATQGREALAKQPLIDRSQPRTVVIGTSKAQVGLDPGSEAWPAGDGPVFNAGLPGSTSPETVASLEAALAAAPVRRVLLLLEPTDFLNVAAPYAPRPPLRHAGWAHVRDLVDATLTLDALQASLRTLAGQWIGPPGGLRPNGQMYDGVFREPTLAEGAAALFGQKGTQNAGNVARLARDLRAHPDAPVAELETLRRVIALCREKGVAMDLVLAPVHADILRAVDLAGLWPRYLLTRQVLAQTVAEPGVGGTDVRLWSFTGFDAYSTEPVPPPGRRGAMLRWYWEPNHFRPEYGELMLQAIYRGRSDVGALLTPGDVDALNRAQTAAMERDRAAQPAEWARVAAALEKAQADLARRR